MTDLIVFGALFIAGAVIGFLIGMYLAKIKKEA